MRRTYSGSKTAFIGLIAGERLLHLLEQRLLEHPGLQRGFVGVVFENVPAAEDQVVQAGQRNEILDLGAAAIGALPQADGGQLGERSDRLGPAGLMASTPAMKVVVTAPMPGIRTPSFPSAGAIWTFSLLGNCSVSPSPVNGLKPVRWRNVILPFSWQSARRRPSAPSSSTTSSWPATSCLFLLKEFPDIEVVATGTNGLEALQLIEKLEPDLVFLDVQMPGLDGMGVIRKAREMGLPLPHFVLATAYDQYAVEAFRLEAMDYLLKPVDKDRLAETIERARRAIEETQKPEALRTRASPAPRPPGPSCWCGARNRNFIVDAQDVVYATIDDG